MAKVVARIKVNGKHFEIHVDLDAALKVREGKGDIMSAVDVPKVFTDVNKGMVASNAELENSFNTTDFYEIAKRIITKGEVQKTQEFRDSEREAKIKQVITILIKNCSDQHGRPYTEERIQRALKEAHINIDNKPAEQQISGILSKLKEIIDTSGEGYTSSVNVHELVKGANLSSNITGNVVGNLNQTSSNWIGGILFIVGLFGVFFYFRKR